MRDRRKQRMLRKARETALSLRNDEWVMDPTASEASKRLVHAEKKKLLAMGHKKNLPKAIMKDESGNEDGMESRVF